MITPKHILFLHPLVKRLEKKGHDVLITSRNYREAKGVIEMRQIPAFFIGKHGGSNNFNKLIESSKRIVELAKIIRDYKPDLCVSSNSPEAARVSFGLGIRHISFSNSPHLEKQMRLIVPFLDKLIIPNHITKHLFSRYGIDQDNIITYHGMDEIVIVKDKTKTKFDPIVFDRPVILVRGSEIQGTIKLREFNIVELIKKISKTFPKYQVVVLPRYYSEIVELKPQLYGTAFVLEKVIDSKYLFSKTKVFVGSGGTMTTEAVLRGVPTISINSSPNPDEEYLVKNNYLERHETFDEIITKINLLITFGNKGGKEKIDHLLFKMENPHDIFMKLIQSPKTD